MISISVVVILIFAKVSFAEENKVDYKGEVIVDSDLDGLTDKGEQQIYQTDPGNQDTDGDGYLDGAEVLAGTDPLDASDYPGHRVADLENNKIDLATPWTWYVARAAGIVGFIFLWITIFLGLAIRNPMLKKIVEPIYSFDFHCFMAAASVFWVLVHGTSLLFDHAISFSIKDVTIPFYANSPLIHTNALALGIMAFYALVITTITSYLRSHIKHWLWRVLHFLNPIAFIFVVLHGYVIGTDMKNIWISGAYLLAAVILALIYFSSLFFVIANKIKQKQLRG